MQEQELRERVAVSTKGEFAMMRPDQELLLDQATACRQLALIASAEDAEKLKALAAEYEQLAMQGHERADPARRKLN